MYYFLTKGTAKQFRNKFRVPRAVFNKIKSELDASLKPHERNRRPDVVHPPEGIAMALHYLGSTGSLTQSADAFNRGDETIRKHTLRVAEAIIEVYGVGGQFSVIDLPDLPTLNKMVNDSVTMVRYILMKQFHQNARYYLEERTPL